jgi:hypothetical protein
MHAAASTSILVSSNSGASSVACRSGDKLGREIKGFKHTWGTVGDDDEIERFDFAIHVCVLGSLKLVNMPVVVEDFLDPSSHGGVTYIQISSV